MKHSVYTAHVGSWLHRHRDSCIYVYVYIHTYICAHVHALARRYVRGPTRIPGDSKVVLVSTREPLDQYTTLPPAPSPPGTSVHPFHAAPVSPLSLSLSLSLPFSSLSIRLPLYNVADVFAHSRERDDTVETGFRPAEDSGRKYFAQQKIF